jgi:hypothetical protein
MTAPKTVVSGSVVRGVRNADGALCAAHCQERLGAAAECCANNGVESAAAALNSGTVVNRPGSTKSAVSGVDRSYRLSNGPSMFDELRQTSA